MTEPETLGGLAWSGPERDALEADFMQALDEAETRGDATCRTCRKPIWNEGGTIGHRKVTEGWSDRIERGGDSLVCFKARDYRHVPLDDAEEEGA